MLYNAAKLLLFCELSKYFNTFFEIIGQTVLVNRL